MVEDRNAIVCGGGLSSLEIQQLDEGTELRLHTCLACGRRNLYAIRDDASNWSLEAHYPPPQRPMSASLDKANDPN
jgi:hypothetical protein